MGDEDAGWWQYRLVVAGSDVGDLEDRLFASGALSITLLDAEDQPILEPAPGETPLWDRVVLVALYPGEPTAQALAREISTSLGHAVEATQLERLADEAWERSWMAHFEPMDFGNGLWIVPSFAEPPEPEAVNVRLDPGLAFGTGTHPTTSLCLRHLAQHPPVGQSVVDYGCGSGVLAIAALMLGASTVWATDLDEQALVASRDNAVANRVDTNLLLSLPDAVPDWRADLLVANILHGPLLALRDTLVDRVRDGGTVVLSGVLQEQARELEAHYAAMLDGIEVTVEEDWCRLCGTVRPRA